MTRIGTATVLFVLATAAQSRADVVVNEIMYHAPNDLDDLQFVELHNTGDQPVNLAGWKFTQGIKHEFAAGSKIEAGGYLVLCKNLKEFKKHYGFDATGEFAGTLNRNSGSVQLVDATGNVAAAVKYGSRKAWPLAPDGYSSSLERICPTAPADGSENWAPSPLSAGSPKPGGTPGKQNSVHSRQLPAVISKVAFSPTRGTPGQEVTVSAEVTAATDLRAVELWYRVAGPGYERGEFTVTMTRAAGNTYTAKLPGFYAGQIARFRVRAVDAAGERFFPHPNDVRPALSLYFHDKFEAAAVPLGFVINIGVAEYRAARQDVATPFGAPPRPDGPARGNSAYVHVNPMTGEPELFDFVHAPPRAGGRKIRFHKDRPLGDLTTINLVYENLDRFVLAEVLAYEVYRKAGVPAPRTEIVRTWIDGRPIGFQLLIEQPNKAFLRHHKIDTGGNMYKVAWTGRDLIARHEKKTNLDTGHDDLVKLAVSLDKVRGDDLWAVIKKEFDVEQMINHYAVRMILSDWDGFFNNYFLYHDTGKTGKWMLFPWDQDKTWGYHDGVRANEVFANMPITFGMDGDQPVGGGWWRPGGDFSRPLLANPIFRKHFLARTKELLEKVYTEDAFGPVIKALGEKLEPEVKARAALRREDEKVALDSFRRTLDTLREHMVNRRDFLLKQDEIKNAGKFDPALLK